ncbi:MAG: hypothetical protein ACQKBT_03300 [Puniceicoccales bacterium]
MNEELKQLEASLRDLRPAPLEHGLNDRLERAMSGELESFRPDLLTLERKASNQSPVALPEELLDQLVHVCAQTPFPVDEKVVLFPGESGPREKPSRKRISHRIAHYAAVACVALAGGLSAYFVQLDDSQATAVVKQEVSSPAPIISDPEDRGHFVPAAFNSGVSNASDLGLMWPDQGRPVRVLKVIYMDEIKMMNDEGEELIYTAPRVEYVVVPEKVD